MRLGRVAAGCLTLVLASAPLSFAHGIHKATLPVDTPLEEFFRLGVVHMLGGYDHLLFVLGIAILFARTADVIKAVTLFTLGHSTTLIVATALGFKLNPTLVDAAIGLSVAYVGLGRASPGR
jgi:hydrogenase/urease accessory protein HupE